MGQREKARALVEQRFEFVKETDLAPDAVSRAALEAAGLSKGLRGSIKSLGGHVADDGTHTSIFQIQGPGGLVGVMDFTVTAAPEGEGSIVRLDVGNFLYQSGSLGLAPSINGGSMMSKFVTLLTTAMTNGAATPQPPLSEVAAAATPSAAEVAAREEPAPLTPADVSTSTRQCPRCGHGEAGEHRFCTTCGTALGPAPILAEQSPSPNSVATPTVGQATALAAEPVEVPVATPEAEAPNAPEGEATAHSASVSARPPAPAEPLPGKPDLLQAEANWNRGVMVAGASIALTIVLWLVFHWLALLAIPVLAILVANAYLTGGFAMDLAKVIGWFPRLVAIVKDAIERRPLRLGANTSVGVTALVLTPVVAGLVSAVVIGGRSTSDDDVCKAYQAYLTAGSSSAYFDSDWFKKLDALGRDAEDYDGVFLSKDTAHAAGTRARQIAKGKGSGMIVTANQAEADQAVAVLGTTCMGIGD